MLCIIRGDAPQNMGPLTALLIERTAIPEAFWEMMKRNPFLETWVGMDFQLWKTIINIRYHFFCFLEQMEKCPTLLPKGIKMVSNGIVSADAYDHVFACVWKDFQIKL